MPNPSVSNRTNYSLTPFPTTTTIVLAPTVPTTTTLRAGSMLGPDADLLYGGIYDGNPFRLRLSGRAYGSASENLTVACFLNNSTNTDLTTTSGDVSILTTSTMATGGAAWVDFSLSAFCMWQATGTTATNQTTGRFTFYPEAGGIISIPGTSSVKVATAVIGNSGTALTSTLAALQFFIVGLTGTADASSLLKATLQIEDIV